MLYWVCKRGRNKYNVNAFIIFVPLPYSYINYNTLLSGCQGLFVTFLIFFYFNYFTFRGWHLSYCMVLYIYSKERKELILMLTEKGKNFMSGLFLVCFFYGIFWEILIGWGNTIRIIAYFLGYQITPL